MSCITVVAAESGAERAPRRQFGGRGRIKAAPEVVARQAKLTLLAFRAHDERDAALDFLNGHSETLAGRPIDVAGASDAGLVAATALLAGSR